MRLTSLQSPISTFELISYFPVRVLMILRASQYCWERKQSEIAAGGLYLSDQQSIIKTRLYDSASHLFSCLRISLMASSLTMMVLRLLEISYINFCLERQSSIFSQKMLKNLEASLEPINFLIMISTFCSFSLPRWNIKASILSIRISQYSSLIFIFSIMSQMFLPFDSYIFSMIFSTISLISGMSFSWQDSSINFIQLIAYSEVFVILFSERTSFRMGITFTKLIGSSLSIFITAYIRMSLELMLSLRTSSSSLDMSIRMGSRISSNRSMTIFLKQFLEKALEFLLEICSRKKMKISWNQMSVWNLVQLEDLLWATLIRMVTISLIQSMVMLCSRLPSWNFYFRIDSKMLKQFETSFSSSFSLIISRRSSKKSGKYMKRSISIISLIQLRRNFLTSKLRVFILSLRMLTNSGKFNSSVLFSTLRTIFLRVLLRKLDEFRTVYSTSLMQGINFSKIMLKSLRMRWFRRRVISKRALMARSLILDSLSLRQLRMQVIIFASQVRSAL